MASNAYYIPYEMTFAQANPFKEYFTGTIRV